MEFSNMLPASWVLLLLAIPIVYALWQIFLSMLWKPLRIKRVFEAQGIRGLPFRFIYGNVAEIVALGKETRSVPLPQLSHDIAPWMLPHFFRWSEKYGKPFFYWFGSGARLLVPEPELAREILSNKSGHYKKPDIRPDMKDLTGDGLLNLQGEKWSQHRRIVSPAFFIEKLKAMTPTVAACAAPMLEKWEAQIEEEESRRCKEIDVHEEFTTLTADIIAHTAFGTSYAEGKQVFRIQHEQQVLFSKAFNTVYIPGARYLPTSTNRYRWRIDNQMQKLLRQMVESRMELETKEGHSDFYGNDLLGLMMAANKKELQGNLSMDIREIIDECKTFFVAGHETTSTLLTWTLMLLASNPEWQERARGEALAVCPGRDPPHADSLNHLKIVGMVLNEALRLYPPVVFLFREAANDMKLGNILVPKGTGVIVPILAFHHDPKYWGPDAQEFNPQRFADGIAKACNPPTAYMPFSSGPRTCVGQTFALLEAKIVLTMILQRFSFHLSPAYKHAPTIVLAMQPQHGMQIIFEKLAK